MQDGWGTEFCCNRGKMRTHLLWVAIFILSSIFDLKWDNVKNCVQYFVVTWNLKNSEIISHTASQRAGTNWLHIEKSTCWETWPGRDYDNNKEFKMTRIFPPKIYMCFVWSLVSKCFSFLLRLFLYRKSMVSTNTLPLFF